jgi:hypothetical protein
MPPEHDRLLAFVEHRIQAAVWGLAGASALLASTLFPWATLLSDTRCPANLARPSTGGPGAKAVAPYRSL